MSNTVLIILIVLLVFLIVFSAFFSAAETAYSSVSKAKIEKEAKSGKKSAILIKKHFNKFGWTLATILICNNLVNISSSALITFLFTKLMGATGTVTIISTFIMTPIIVIFGEIMPKLLAKKHAYGYLSKIAYTMEFFNIILFPFTYPLSKIALQSNITNSEKDLKDLLNIAKSEGVLDIHEATLAKKALDLDSKPVSKVMTKKQAIISLNENDTIEKALLMFKKYGFSRIPVKNNEKYIGLIILKDIFLVGDKTGKVKDHIVEINTVSKHILVTKALEQMRMLKSHMVLVTETQDSHKIAGLLTIEDIVEELVGEIYDEHDADLSIREIAHFKWLALGTILAKDVQEAIGVDLEIVDENDSIKQWLQSRINRKIKKGLKYSYKEHLIFKIISNKNNEETKIEILKK